MAVRFGWKAKVKEKAQHLSLHYLRTMKKKKYLNFESGKGGINPYRQIILRKELNRVLIDILNEGI
jgi:hypothetical protein